MDAIKVSQQQPRRDLGRDIPNPSPRCQDLCTRSFAGEWRDVVVDRLELWSIVSKALRDGGSRARAMVFEWARSASTVRSIQQASVVPVGARLEGAQLTCVSILHKSSRWICLRKEYTVDLFHRTATAGQFPWPPWELRRCDRRAYLDLLDPAWPAGLGDPLARRWRRHCLRS